MKTLFVIAILGICVPLTVAGTVMVNAWGYGQNNVGEFLITPSIPGIPQVQVGTFCVETEEYLTVPGGPYNANVNTMAIKGGTGAGENPDPLGYKTAWLFWQYWTNAITIDSADKAVGFQMAIWTLESETHTRAMTIAEQGFYNGYIASANASNWTDIGSVRVLNLGDAPGYGHQDLLIPEPATMALLGLGSVISLVLRKRTV